MERLLYGDDKSPLLFLGSARVRAEGARARLLHFLVLRLGLLQDGAVGVGVFPEREEILIRGTGLGSVVLQHIGAGQAEMSECSNCFVLHNTALVKDFLELNRGFAALMRRQIRSSTHIGGIHSRRESAAAWEA